MEQSTPSPALIELYEDSALREVPDSVIGRKVVEIHTGFLHFQAIAASSSSLMVRHAVALGQLFEEASKRHEGEFEDWLKCAVGEDAEGRPRMCLETSRRYRTMFRKRLLLFPVDGSEPECRTMTEAFIKCGIIPAPQRADQEAGEKPLFRLSFSVPEIDVAQWPASEKAAFLTKTQPIADLRAKLEAAA